MVGNSSAAIREGSFLGTPAVTVGSRQQNRERGPNVIEVSHDVEEIADTVRDQIEHGPYPSSALFGDGMAGRRIADVLATAQPTIQKRLRLDVAADAVQAAR
jgi:UDP-N-acetylglucosamine 2-epimerase